MRSSTSRSGRPQFSVEKAYTARLRTPRSGDGTAHGDRIEADERALPHRHGRAVDLPVAVSGDDHRHLLLSGAGLVVLPPTHAGRQIESVDAERLDTQRAAHETYGAARP